MSFRPVINALLVVPLLLAGCGGPGPTRAATSAPSDSGLLSPSPTQPPAPFPAARFAALKERPLSAARAAKLQAVLAKAASGSGVTATVMSPAGSWTGAVGHAEGRIRMRPDSQMAIGSVTKSIVAAQVMQLVETGDLSLDDPVDDHLPAWVRLDTNQATIRQLLAMRSGLADYVDAEALFNPRDPRDGETWREALARVGPPRGPAGVYFEYTNANYLLLGLVIEEVQGRSLAKALRAGVLAGKGLGRLVLQPEERPSSPMAMPSEETGAFDKGGGFLPSLSAISGAGGAGAMASDAATLARWWARFCGGKIVSQATLDEMTAFRVGDDRYGLGLAAEDDGYRPGIGHEGLQMGFAAWATCLYEDGLVITVLSNDQELVTGDVAQALGEAAAAWA